MSGQHQNNTKLHNLQNTKYEKLPVYSARAVSAIALAFIPSLLHMYVSLQ